MNACVEFGNFIKDTRKAKGIIARTAAEVSEMLPSNFSKLEHGILRPPSENAKQKLLAAAIGIEPNSPLERTFFDLAGKANNATPVDIAEIISEETAWPLLLRTAGNKRLTEDQIKKLIQIVKGETVVNSTSQP